MKLETQMLIARNLRTLRTSKCISQAYFAKELGVSRSTYVSYEMGTRVPDAEVLFSIAQFFGLNMNVLFESNQYNFLSHLENCDIYDKELLKLLENYRTLSSFAKGMLLERSVALVEWDKLIEANKATAANLLKESK
ncbi:MAG: helix-turn-helix transcriptional regulator [Anaerovoracaceae bacterium]|nr:helix-turn-helix transcriptional regulator [Bacillota bacterium]MEE0516960.1 helix-turn-helix transcriptional regulator [Anaerovoracaceae bacterium]